MTIPGINIRHPWSEALLEGRKSFETRHYRLPKKYIGKPLALVETYGGKKKAMVVGIICFGEPVMYQSAKEFYRDFDRHLVSDKSEYGWISGKKKKWGWPVTKIIRLEKPIPAPTRRGYVWTGAIQIPPVILMPPRPAL